MGVFFLVLVLVGCSQKRNDGMPSGDLVLENLQAVSGTELKANFGNGETKTITDFTPKPLEVGKETEVSFTYEDTNYSKNIKYVITINGSFADSSQKILSTADTSSFTVDDIANVVLFFGEEYKIAEVKNGSFSITIDQNKPGGIAFLDSGNNYIGYLSLAEGLDSFPTQAISKETGKIDLEEITFDESGMGTPDSNPLKDYITDKEKNLLITAQSFFGAALRSPDLIELMVSKEDLNFNISLAYNINNIPEYEVNFDKVEYKNSFGMINNEYDEPYPIIGSHGLGVNINLGAAPEEVYINYPNDIRVDTRVEYSKVGSYQFEGVGRPGAAIGPTGPPIPQAGEYKFVFGNEKTLNLNIPSLAEPTKENLVFPTPTLHLSENEKGNKIIDKITWKYRDANGNIIENPDKIIGKIGENMAIHIGIQIEGVDGYIEEDVVPLGTQEYVLKKEVGWKDGADKIFRNVNMSYQDIYGIDYTVPFSDFESGWDGLTIKEKAKNKGDILIEGFENEDAETLEKLLASDFSWYLDGELIFSSRDYYINFMNNRFKKGATIENINYQDVIINVENDSYVKISGHWSEEGTDKDGSEVNYDNNNTFHIKKINGRWLITKLDTVSNN